jgi:hypothetical protein
MVNRESRTSRRVRLSTARFWSTPRKPAWFLRFLEYLVPFSTKLLKSVVQPDLKPEMPTESKRREDHEELTAE